MAFSEPLPTESARERLRAIIQTTSLKRGEFVLASGKRSDVLFDLKTTLLDPEGAYLTGQLLMHMLPPDITAVGGLELGACPVVSNCCVLAHILKRPLHTFYVRKEAKGRGTNQRIEGYHPTKQDRVMICEDVTTTGGSALQAIDALQQTGCVIAGVMSVVDRSEGASETLAKHHIPLYALFQKEELLA